MAIGTLAAVALGASALGSAAISRGASNKAANAATDAANQNAAVQREQLGAAQNALNPFVQAGTPASQQINALLGLDTGNYQQFLPQQQYQFDASNYWDGGFGYARTPAPYTEEQIAAARQAAAADSKQRATNAFDVFKQNVGYQDALNSAMDAVNSGYAGAGTIKSGAAIKAAQDRAGEIAQGTFGNYLNALGNQQAIGMSAGSALAGVGQNYANSMMFNNNARADAIGNSALLNAQNTNNMLGGLTAGIFKYGVG